MDWRKIIYKKLFSSISLSLCHQASKPCLSSVCFISIIRFPFCWIPLGICTPRNRLLRRVLFRVNLFAFSFHYCSARPFIQFDLYRNKLIKVQLIRFSHNERNFDYCGYCFGCLYSYEGHIPHLYLNSPVDVDMDDLPVVVGVG